MEKSDDSNRVHDLTIEEIKACEEYKNLSDEKAQRLIETIKIFTQVVFEHYQKKSENKISKKEMVIPLRSNLKNQAA